MATINRTMASAVLLLLSLLFLSSSTSLHQDSIHFREQIDDVHLENTSLLSADPNPNEAEVAKTWCVARPSTPWFVLDGLIAFFCTKVICTDILIGGKCYCPPNKISDASVTMNLFYKFGGAKPEDCNFNGYGLLVNQDPSFSLCTYP